MPKTIEHVEPNKIAGVTIHEASFDEEDGCLILDTKCGRTFRIYGEVTPDLMEEVDA